MKYIQPEVELLTTESPMRIMERIEKAGRLCYRSESTPDSFDRFIRGIIKSGHESVIEHGVVSFRIVCSRGCANQMVRHRLASYSQESTRYVGYHKEKFGGEIQFIVPQFDSDKQFKGKTQEEVDEVLDVIEEAYIAAEAAYMKLTSMGATPDLAREVLPNGTKTELVMTANMREWRHFIKVRSDKAAHPEIRIIAQLIKEVLQIHFPPLFDDL